MLFAVTGLLLPSRLQSPSSYPVETIAAPRRKNDGAERNRTAVRDIGVDHLVHSKMNLYILTVTLLFFVSNSIKTLLSKGLDQCK